MSSPAIYQANPSGADTVVNVPTQLAGLTIANALDVAVAVLGAGGAAILTAPPGATVSGPITSPTPVYIIRPAAPASNGAACVVTWSADAPAVTALPQAGPAPVARWDVRLTQDVTLVQVAARAATRRLDVVVSIESGTPPSLRLELEAGAGAPLVVLVDWTVLDESGFALALGAGTPYPLPAILFVQTFGGSYAVRVDLAEWS